MKRLAIVASLAALCSTAALAANTKLHCIAKKGEVEITLSATLSVFDGKNKVGLIKSYELLILDEVQGEFNGIEFRGHTSISDRNVANIKYNGRKYKGYLNFNLLNYKSSDLKINGGIEDISLIVSPKYKVVDTEARNNYWNEDWTWDVETRQYDAVFPLNLDDHHGDYIKGKCYSKTIVNEVKPQ